MDGAKKLRETRCSLERLEAYKVRLGMRKENSMVFFESRKTMYTFERVNRGNRYVDADK